MTVPFTGALVIALGAYLFFFSPRLLYAALVISIPFSATAIIDFGSGDAARGVAAWLFLGFLWVFRESISTVPPWRKAGWFATRSARCRLLAFLGAVFASLLVPLILNGTSWVPVLDPQSLDVINMPLGFGVNNQVRTLTFGVLLTIVVAAENCTSSRLFYTLKLYVGSCVFAAFWGVFQFWCNLTGHEYPAYVFNTSTSETAGGYRQTLMGLDLHRVSSVAFEPSILAEELLIALVVLLVCRGIQRPLISKRSDVLAVTLIAAGLLVTTSTTAYAGLLIVCLFTGIVLFKAGWPSKPYFISVGAIVAALALAAALVPILGQLASVVLLNKLQGGSGAGRLQSVVIAAHDFLKYPISGTGWGTVYSSDLVFLILANTGLIGFLALLSFLYPVLSRLWSANHRRDSAAAVLLGAVLVVLALSQVAMFMFLAGYDWLFLGLAAGAVAAGRVERTMEKGRALAVLRSGHEGAPAEAIGPA